MRENADQKTSEYVYFLRSVEVRVVSLANFSHDFIEKIGKVVPPKSSESASLGRDMVNNKIINNFRPVVVCLITIL